LKKSILQTVHIRVFATVSMKFASRQSLVNCTSRGFCRSCILLIGTCSSIFVKSLTHREGTMLAAFKHSLELEQVLCHLWNKSPLSCQEGRETMPYQYGEYYQNRKKKGTEQNLEIKSEKYFLHVSLQGQGRAGQQMTPTDHLNCTHGKTHEHNHRPEQ
jgi:hypothetical protein